MDTGGGMVIRKKKTLEERASRSGQIDRKKNIELINIFHWPLTKTNFRENKILIPYLSSLLKINYSRPASEDYLKELIIKAEKRGHHIEESKYLSVRYGRVCKMSILEGARCVRSKQEGELKKKDYSEYVRRNNKFNNFLSPPNVDFSYCKVYDVKWYTKNVRPK